MQIWKIYCCDWSVDYSEVRFLGRYFYLSACKSRFWTDTTFPNKYEKDETAHTVSSSNPNYLSID